MATGYLSGKYEQNGASDFTPKPGNEVTTPIFSSKVMYFPIQSAVPNLNPNPLERDDELRNYDQPLLRVTDTFDPTWDYTSRAYPDVIGWHLANLLGRDTTSGYAVAAGAAATDLDGTTALAAGQYAHTWTAPFGPAGAIPQTSQLIYAYKDQATFYQMSGCATEQFEVDTPDNGGVGIKASGPATYLNSITDPSLTPAYETAARRPFVHGNLAVSYTDTSSGYTTANAGVASGFTVQANQPVNAVRTLGVTSQYPDRMEKDDGPIMFSGSIAKRNLTKADWDAMKALQTFKLVAKWTSTDYIVGSTGAKYGLSMTFANAQLVGGSIDPLDNKRRHGASYNWNAVYDGSTASVVVKLVNATATYAV